ncbi:MAG: tRNA 4-thiouridine(8) synthase ThiI [Endozoicomonadaceae bacterium]|nr:tRNA 4-thiouridine(8) synthase ThiI [Endozoicomonadaceae bacterium]
MKFIIKLFSEITIKSTPVRKRFVKQLRRNIRNVCRPLDEQITATGTWDIIYVETVLSERPDIDQLSERLCCIPGIHQVLEVAEHPLTDIEDILEKAAAVWLDALTDKTFAVRVHRSGNHDFRSIDVERLVGGGLIERSKAAGVRLKNPDIKVEIEIKNDCYFMVQRRLNGLGGYPLGTQDPVLSLISGGFDSTVSSFLMSRRGMTTHFCFFNLGGHAHELAVKEVAYYLWSQYAASHRVRFVTIPFEGVVEEILNKIENSQMGVILKRMMLRAATAVAKEMKIQALVTGEAIAQVSSQTLPNLAVIDSVTDMLVLRPLITMDKQDIINVASRIGTEVFAKNIPEYCAVISKKPTTCAKPAKIMAEEAHFNVSVMDAAIESRRTVSVHDIIADDLTREAVEVVSQVGKNEIIIDIRHPSEEEIKPFTLPNHKALTIPFYQLATRFSELDAGNYYLLYCEKGLMSQLHAMHLRDAGHDNVGVYQP